MSTSRRAVLWVLVLALEAGALGCRSRFATVAPRPPERFTVVGPTSGSGCGVLFGFFPILINGRTERAYQEAIKRVQASALTDTKLTDSWFWTPIGLFLCTNIEGTGIRDAAVGSAVPVTP